jgi:hypothetical protein
MFTKLFKTVKKRQAPRTASVTPLSDANLEQVRGGISGKIAPSSGGSGVGNGGG